MKSPGNLPIRSSYGDSYWRTETPWVEVPGTRYNGRFSGGACRVRLFKPMPGESAETKALRSKLCNEIGTIKYRSPKRKPNPFALENHGRAVLYEPTPTVKRAFVARIHYVSMGGERLCADFGNLTESEANAAIGSRYDAVKDVWYVGNGSVYPAGGDLAECGDCEGDKGICTSQERVRCFRCKGKGKSPGGAPETPHGYRLVVFPSERKDLVEVTRDVPE